MKTLVVYYSRTGCTRLAAERIGRELDAEVVELKEQTDRKGVLGFLKSGHDAIRKKPATLLPVDQDPAAYDLLIAGSPVWADTLCPAVRTYLEQSAASVRRCAFFCTHGGGGAGNSFKDAEALLGKPPAATVALRGRALKKNEPIPELDAFLDAIKSLVP